MRSEDEALPVRWMAVEVLVDGQFSLLSDVWSIGVVIWEVFMDGEMPYPSLNNDEVLSGVVAGHRMDRPPSCPPEMWTIAFSCWNSVESRPTFSQLHEQVNDHLQHVSAVDIEAEAEGNAQRRQSIIFQRPSLVSSGSLGQDRTYTGRMNYRRIGSSGIPRVPSDLEALELQAIPSEPFDYDTVSPQDAQFPPVQQFPATSNYARIGLARGASEEAALPSPRISVSMPRPALKSATGHPDIGSRHTNYATIGPIRENHESKEVPRSSNDTGHSRVRFEDDPL